MNKKYQSKPIYQAFLAFIIACLFIIPGSASLFNDLQEKGHHTTERGSSIYVDDSNTAGPWDGSMEHPYQFIQDGIDHANGGDTVRVLSGRYTENIVIPISLELIGEGKDSTVITGDDFGTVVKIIAEGVTISGFKITHCGSNPNNAGILIHTPYNTIFNNSIEDNNYYGIYIVEGYNNTIYHNNIVGNTYQAFDALANSIWDGGYPDGGNYWDDYEGTDANEDGMGDIPYPTGNSSTDRYPLIHPYGSIRNTDTHETFLSIQAAINDDDTQDGQLIVSGTGVFWEHLSISKSIILVGVHGDCSIIDGRFTGDVITICADEVSISGFMIQHSGAGEQNAGIVVSGNNCSIMQNTIYDNFQGIILKQSIKNIQIVDNKISDNGWNGITLNSGCTGIHIFGNTIADNFYAGIGISEASNNYIYHNNFKTNRHQAYDDAANIWDDGYPSGGNYWSDYTGFDDDGDGFGDTPYAIPEGINIDRYPLMAPYAGEDTIPPIVKIQTPSNGLYLWGFHLFSGLFRKNTIIYGPITIQVEASDAQSGIAQVEFLIDDSVNPNFVDTQEPYVWEWSQPSFFLHKHTIIVIVYDNAGNHNYDMLEVRKYL
ncbi:MAG: right-handed parallel beta-helix repeat-containing protein [Euryarchaeota archaeon]|nr:right-handed parallel beta-helix repeat-containing protein [Euryarchaeota archaeon]